MRYTISASAVKTSASSVTAYLKQKGFVIPHHVALELVAKALHLKNYNTLQALATSPRVIDSYETEKKYLIEMTCDARKEELLNLLSISFNQANAQLNLSNFLVAENTENSKYNDYLLEIDLLKSDTNILMAMFLLCESFKKEHIVVTRFEYVRLACEKESMMAYFNQPVISTMSESNNSVSRKTRSFSELRQGMSQESQKRAEQRSEQILDEIEKKQSAIDKMKDKHRSEIQMDNHLIRESNNLAPFNEKEHKVLIKIFSKMNIHEKAFLGFFAAHGCGAGKKANDLFNETMSKFNATADQFKKFESLLGYCEYPQTIAVLKKVTNENSGNILKAMYHFAQLKSNIAVAISYWIQHYDKSLWQIISPVNE